MPGIDLRTRRIWTVRHAGGAEQLIETLQQLTDTGWIVFSILQPKEVYAAVVCYHDSGVTRGDGNASLTPIHKQTNQPSHRPKAEADGTKPTGTAQKRRRKGAGRQAAPRAD